MSEQSAEGRERAERIANETLEERYARWRRTGFGWLVELEQKHGTLHKTKYVRELARNGNHRVAISCVAEDVRPDHVVEG